MRFKLSYWLLIPLFLLALSACSDSENEDKLVNLFISANQDLIAISFPSDTTETTISTNAFIDYTLEGLQSNGVDTISITNDIIWSLSSGATSTIDQTGRLSSGDIAELITVTAQVGHLSQTLDVNVSTAKFDRVVALNSTTVLINMCQSKTIVPMGSYLNDDGSEEIRSVDSSIINTIAWSIINPNDASTSQLVLINTQNNITSLQAFESGKVTIRATAISKVTGNEITSKDLGQTIKNNLNSLKLCLASDTDLANCELGSTNIIVNDTLSIITIANYLSDNGNTFNENISAYSKWGIDNNNIATLAFSTDRSQINISGLVSNSTANISAACGEIQQPITDDDLQNGVVLTTSVSCKTDCQLATAALPVIDTDITGLSVEANNIALVDNVETKLITKPVKIALNVTALFSNNPDKDVTTEPGIEYKNQTSSVITQDNNTPNEFTVNTSGTAKIQIEYDNQIFIAVINIPN